MKLNALTSVAILTSLSISNHSYSETLQEYVAACKAALGISTIPGYSCNQNQWPVSSVSIPSALDGIATENNFVGKVTFDEAPNVDAVFLCRNAPGGTAGLNGYIIQHRITGETCFFDAIAGAETTVPSLDAPNASSFWRQPSDVAGQDCHSCHSNDPFIVTESLSQAFNELNLIQNGRNLLGPYEVVGSDDPSSVFFGWNDEINNATSANTETCAQACHRLTDTVHFLDANNEWKSGSFIKNLASVAKDSFMGPIAASYFPDDFLESNDKYTIQNYWAGDWYLNVQNGPIAATSINQAWDSAQWTFEKVGDYYWIKNVENPNLFLHEQNGQLEAGNILSGWWSAQWRLIKEESFNVPDGASNLIYKIQNRWTDNYINVEGGTLQSSSIGEGWWSARWYFNKK